MFQKHLAKKGFVEERGFKQLVTIQRGNRATGLGGGEPTSGARGKGSCQRIYANLGEQKNLTCYVRGRLILLRERAISQLL